MSDQSQGPGWWQASDGQWYPPEQAPAPVPLGSPTQPFGVPPGPAAAPAPRSGLGTGPIIAIVVAAVALIAGVVFFATKDGGSNKNAAATSSSSSKSSNANAGAASGAPKITAPSGFTVFSNDADAFAIAIPQRLEVIDLTSADLDRVIQQLADNNPQMAKVAPQIKQVFQNGGKLFAIDTSSGEAAGLNDNVNVIATNGTVDVTAESTKSQAEAQLSSIGATNVRFDTLTANGRKILASSYQAMVNSSDGTPITFFGHQALISAAGKIWFITFSTVNDDIAAFTTMVESFDANG